MTNNGPFGMVQYIPAQADFKNKAIYFLSVLLYSIQTMNTAQKKSGSLESLPTMPTQSSSLSPTTIPHSISLHSHSMPHMVLQRSSQPLSPQYPPLSIQCYILDFDSTMRKYQTIKVNQQSSGFFMREITELILSYLRVHVKTIPNKSSPIQPAQSKVMKPIIFPVYDSKKYAFVFQTTQQRQNVSGMELSDRFIVFVCDQFLPYTLSEMVKTITKMEFQDRAKDKQKENCKDSEMEQNGMHGVSEQGSNIPSLACRQSLLQLINAYICSSRKLYFSKPKNLASQRLHQQQWYLRNISTYSILVRLNTLHYQPILLLTLLLYYTIREYKIIMVGWKQNRHIMSENAIALKSVLSPIEYCYPLVFAAISQGHDDYMDSPVPCLICYWGEQKQCNKIKTRYKRVNDEASMPSVLIDLNSLTAFTSITKEYESRVMLYMNGMIVGQKNQEGSVAKRASRYVKQHLVECQREDLKEQSAIFQKSLSYQHYMQSKK